MKNFIKTWYRHFLCAAIFCSISAEGFAEQYLFLAATKDRDLVTYTVDAKTGALKEHARLKLPGNGGPMSQTQDGKYLYVESHINLDGEKRPVPHIITLQNKAGKLTHLKTARVALRSPTIHVDASGKNLLAAHYGPGKVSVWKIDENHICTGELIDDHSTAEKAHFIVTDPNNRFAYVPHTSPNSVYQFSLNADTGKLTPLDPPFAKGPDEDHSYHQPRHLAFHPTLPMAYTANERGGGISAWKADRNTGVLSLSETLSTLPPDWVGGSAGADIHITPNGRFVYMSNRDVRKLEDGATRGDTLAGFEIDPKTGALKLIGHFPTEPFPRSFCIDRTGNFVYAAGQKGDQMAAYRIDQQSGELKKIATYETGQTPIWVMCWSE